MNLWEFILGDGRWVISFNKVSSARLYCKSVLFRE